MAMIGAETSVQPGAPAYESMSTRVAYGGGYLLIGDDQDVANQFQKLSDAEVDGVIIVWADPVDGLERFADRVAPQLVRRGLRV
jgi:alkanesulfonate monooxygenase SsuD/methylene tetrahydromethanopterin reductase-like flavin-dependent oxidoreductase (luciferase family)